MLTGLEVWERAYASRMPKCQPAASIYMLCVRTPVHPPESTQTHVHNNTGRQEGQRTAHVARKHAQPRPTEAHQHL